MFRTIPLKKFLTKQGKGRGLDFFLPRLQNCYMGCIQPKACMLYCHALKNQWTHASNTRNVWGANLSPLSLSRWREEVSVTNWITISSQLPLRSEGGGWTQTRPSETDRQAPVGWWCLGLSCCAQPPALPAGAPQAFPVHLQSYPSGRGWSSEFPWRSCISPNPVTMETSRVSQNKQIAELVKWFQCRTLTVTPAREDDSLKL